MRGSTARHHRVAQAAPTGGSEASAALREILAPEPGRSRSVGVREPGDRRSLLTVLEVRDGAVATSGTYERGEHVWDGRTGEPATGLLSATVVAADLPTAAVLATCVLAKESAGIAWATDHGAAVVVASVRTGELVTRTPREAVRVCA